MGHFKGWQSPQPILQTLKQAVSINLLLPKQFKLSMPDRHSLLIYTYTWLTLVFSFLFLSKKQTGRTGTTPPTPATAPCGFGHSRFLPPRWTGPHHYTEPQLQGVKPKVWVSSPPPSTSRSFLPEKGLDPDFIRHHKELR